MAMALLLVHAVSGAHTAVPLSPGERIALDGILDEAAWLRAPAHGAFHQYDPHPGTGAAPFETRVRFAFDAHALYVAVHALDPQPQRIRAPFARHDKVLRGQDFVVLYVDAIGSRAAAQFFRVNARGAKSDGVQTTDYEDFSPDFDWDCAARITADGYAVEMRIPFATLRFAHASSVPWRVMLGRSIPREQTYLFLSVPLPRQAQSFLAELAPLAGFSGPTSESTWSARPYATVRRLTESPDDLATRRNQAELGVDLKYRPRADWVIDATLNPDFSQIELDTPQLSRNTQFALFFPEKRPFFLEGSDLFQMPTDSLYSRSVTDPRWGLRATYRSEALAGALLTAHDEGRGLVLVPGPFATATATQPPARATIARARWNVPGVDSLTFGAIASDRQYDTAGINQVGGPDMVWQFTGNDRLRAQYLSSSTTALPDTDHVLRKGQRIRGHLAFLDWNHSSEHNHAELRYREASNGYRNDNGFQPQADFRSVNGLFNHQFRRSAVLHEITPFIAATGTETSSSSQTVERQAEVGLFLAGPRKLEIETKWHPRHRQRARAGGVLHELHNIEVHITANPSRMLTQINVDFDLGRRVDLADDSVRPSLAWSAGARIRAGDRLEFEPLVSRLQLDGASDRVFTETVAQLLSVAHFSSYDSLRLIVQRSEARRRVDPSSPTTPFEFAGSIGSLVYAHRRSAACAIYVGAGRNRPRTDGTLTSNELFVKLQFGT